MTQVYDMVAKQLTLTGQKILTHHKRTIVDCLGGAIGLETTDKYKLGRSQYGPL